MELKLILEESVGKVNLPQAELANRPVFLYTVIRICIYRPKKGETPVKTSRIRTVFILAAAISVISLVILALAAVFDFFHVGGSELSWADLANDEAIVTVERWDDSGAKLSEVQELTRGQGIAMQSLLLRTHYLRRTSGSLRIKDNSISYKILIHFPEQNASLQLFEGVSGLYLLSPEYSGWLKILDPDWDTAFQGILTAG